MIIACRTRSQSELRTGGRMRQAARTRPTLQLRQDSGGQAPPARYDTPSSFSANGSSKPVSTPDKPIASPENAPISSLT